MVAATSALLPQCQPAGASYMYTFPASSLPVLDTAIATFRKWSSFLKPLNPSVVFIQSKSTNVLGCSRPFRGR